jgi:hypothetical protein
MFCACRSGGGGPQYLPELVSGVGGGCSRNVESPNSRPPLLWGWSGSTLLGPERTTGPALLGGVWVVLCVSRGDRLPALSWEGVVAVRVVVENCTVDASIFCFCAHLCRDFLMCVLVKLLRAHGGCLGIRSR